MDGVCFSYEFLDGLCNQVVLLYRSGRLGIKVGPLESLDYPLRYAGFGMSGQMLSGGHLFYNG